MSKTAFAGLPKGGLYADRNHNSSSKVAHVLAAEQPSPDAFSLDELQPETLQALIDDPGVPEEFRQAAQQALAELSDDSDNVADETMEIAASFDDEFDFEKFCEE